MAFILSITNPAGERLPEVVYKDLDKKNEYMEEHRKESIKKYNEEMPTFSELKSYYQFRWTHLFIKVLCGVIGSLLLVLDRKH